MLSDLKLEDVSDSRHSTDKAVRKVKVKHVRRHLNEETKVGQVVVSIEEAGDNSFVAYQTSLLENGFSWGHIYSFTSSTDIFLNKIIPE